MRVRRPTSPSLDIVGVGEAMVELSADRPLGEASTLHRGYGGDVLNSLVVAARLDDAVGFVSKVGDDPFGAALLREWREEGVELTNCSLVPGVNGVYFIHVGQDGDREFSYHRLGSAASSLGPEDLDEEYLASARIVLLSGITQAISESGEAATLRAACIAKESGAMVAFDPNFRPTLWAQRAARQGLMENQGPELARLAAENLIEHVDVLLPSFPADRALWGPSSTSPAQFIDACSATSVSLIGIKLGNRGSCVLLQGRKREVATVTVGAVVDSTGAGDAWNAGFLHSLLKGHEAAEAAAFGNLVAAWKLQYRGALPPRGARPPAYRHG